MFHDPESKQRNVWLFRNSSFTECIIEDRDLTQRCLDYDWAKAKIDNMFSKDTDNKKTYNLI